MNKVNIILIEMLPYFKKCKNMKNQDRKKGLKEEEGYTLYTYIVQNYPIRHF